MDQVDARLRAALERQFEARRALLRSGARRVGWKLGMGDAERIGDEVALGYLTSTTVVPSGAEVRPVGPVALHADAELALEFGCDVPADADDGVARRAIVGYGAALEIVDLGDTDKGAEAVVAGNVFHRAVVLGAIHHNLPAPALAGCLVVNGQVRASAPVTADIGARVRAAARVLGAMGEQLRRGDRLITGSVVQVAVEPGHEVIADFGALGQAAATIR